MSKAMMLKKVEDIIKDKELDDDAKIMMIMVLMKHSRKSDKKNSK